MKNIVIKISPLEYTFLGQMLSRCMNEWQSLTKAAKEVSFLEFATVSQIFIKKFSDEAQQQWASKAQDDVYKFKLEMLEALAIRSYMVRNTDNIVIQERLIGNKIVNNLLTQVDIKFLPQ